MDAFQALSQSVAEAIRQGRPGTPVSARVLDFSTADHGRVEANLARGIDAVCGWLGGTPEHVSASGDVASGQVTALLRFGSGATALVTAGTCGHSSPALHAMLVGNKAVCSWESPDPAELDESPAFTPPPRGLEVLKAVRQALKAREGTDNKEAPATPPRQTAEVRVRNPPGKPPYGTLLIAGGATHQEDYARALAADPRCKVLAVVDEPDVSPRRKEWNARLAQELNIPVWDDLDAALARDDVHVVSVCAEPDRRARVILRCAQAAKHLYLDKPLAASADEDRRIVSAVRQAGVVSQMFSMVHTTTAARARQVVRSGRIGEIVAVHVDQHFAKGPAGTATPGKPRAETRRPSQFERVDTKREMYNVGVYPVVLISWLLGRPVRRVSSATGNYFFREHQANDMEDFGLMLLDLEGGVTASVTAGRTGWRSHPQGGVHQIVLVGTRGVASINAYRPRLEVWGDEPPWLAPRTDPADPMGFWRSTPVRLGMPPKRAWITPDGDPPAVADARHFLDRLELGLACDIDAEAGAAALEVLLAAYESASTGKAAEVGRPGS
ncbi:MAG: Gfo/Idh/MocA family oxidoreductase [Isosphaeraceae bacterium]